MARQGWPVPNASRPAKISRADLPGLVAADTWMMEVLSVAASADLPDWWIGAGFLRNKIWDTISGNRRSVADDVDLVYFDAGATDPEVDWGLDQEMCRLYPGARWEVRNQARMHLSDGFEPYSSTADGIAHWVETATCVGVRLHEGQLRFLFCHGSDDLVNMIARPTAAYRAPDRIDVFRGRLAQKEWRARWSTLVVLEG